MEIKAKLNYLHIAPRKVRLVSNLIKGMDVQEARTQLKFMPQRTSGYLLKLLDSAVSNAKNNFKIDKEGLFVKEIRIDEGVPFKRWRPVSRGRAFPVLKRTCSINLVLGTREGFKVKEIEKEIKEIEKEAEQKEIKTTKEESKISSDKIKVKAPKELKKVSKFKGLAKKIFRRKSF
ncbi:MAG: 50S ribosomal protein L22 [bacterium]|nr:50S ribosomal protein L22 [bacterium]